TTTPSSPPPPTPAGSAPTSCDQQFPQKTRFTTSVKGDTTMKRRTVMFGLAATAGTVLAGCASGSDEPTGAGGSDDGGGGAYTPGEFEAKDPLKIGYSVYDLQNPYWQSYAD